MNDMSAPIKAVINPGETSLCGHRFRGRFLDKCAAVERWAVEVLLEAGEATKSCHLFGHKLAAVRKLALEAESRLKSPKKVLHLLDQFQPFATLRSDLAHSTLRTATTDEESVLIFTSCNQAREEGWKSVVLGEKEQRQVLTGVSRLANELGQQGVRLPVNPS
jgi:hypothetical protein